MRQQKLNTVEVGQRIKQFRQKCGLSMRELAAKADVTASLISRIEAGKISPTVASLQKITGAMDIDIYEFFQVQIEEDPTERMLFKSADMAISEDRDRRWAYAFPRHPKLRLQLTYEEYQPRTQAIEWESHTGDLACIVLEGTMTMETSDNRLISMDAGDACYIKAGQVHSSHNDGDEVVKLVTAEIR